MDKFQFLCYYNNKAHVNPSINLFRIQNIKHITKPNWRDYRFTAVIKNLSIVSMNKTESNRLWLDESVENCFWLLARNYKMMKWFFLFRIRSLFGFDTHYGSHKGIQLGDWIRLRRSTWNNPAGTIRLLFAKASIV